MNQKQIGVTIIIAAIVMAGFVYAAKAKEDAYINTVVHETGSCYLDDGTCLHQDREMIIYIIGWSLSAALFLFGAYLTFFDKTQEVLAEHQIKVSSALEQAKKQDKEKDEFRAFLAGFSEDEKKILSALKEQEGILQSTLRYRTGFSKTTLSLMLKSLEERDIITRKLSGKTNEVFLRKKF